MSRSHVLAGSDVFLPDQAKRIGKPDGAATEPPRVYRRVEHSKDKPYDKETLNLCLHGALLEQGDLEGLPFEDDSFDVVTGFNSFQFATDPVVALQEARRVTTSGGKVFVMTWGEPMNAILKTLSDKALAGLTPNDRLAPFPHWSLHSCAVSFRRQAQRSELVIE